MHKLAHLDQLTCAIWSFAMRRLFVDPLNINCLAALATAHKVADVEIIKYGAEKGKTIWITPIL